MNTTLRLPGETRDPAPMPHYKAYGECTSCHRLVAIPHPDTYEDNGDPVGKCASCDDRREAR